VLDSQGNLYGTGNGRGADGYGAVYELVGGTTEVVLWSFSNGSDGGTPTGSLLLVEGVDGVSLYGVTEQGGSTSSGLVFELIP
jgi:hypothetical protein